MVKENERLTFVLISHDIGKDNHTCVLLSIVLVFEILYHIFYIQKMNINI